MSVVVVVVVVVVIVVIVVVVIVVFRLCSSCVVLDRLQTFALTVSEIPRSWYTHVTGRRRMSSVVFACHFEGLRLE